MVCQTVWELGPNGTLEGSNGGLNRAEEVTAVEVNGITFRVQRSERIWLNEVKKTIFHETHGSGTQLKV